jgi:hypothetical protein
MPPNGDFSIREIEERWRARLSDARRRYSQASAQFCKTAEEYRQLRVTDPGLALREAIAEESLARREYIRTLHAFTDLIVNQRIPEEELFKVQTGQP